MEYAIIEEGKIMNVIVAGREFAAEIGAVCCDGLPIGIGDSFEDGRFKKIVPEYDEEGNQIGEHEEYYDVPSDEPKPSPEELQQRYDALAVEYIHDRYSYDDENKIIREYIANPDDQACKQAFEAYNAYVLECKQRAYDDIYNNKIPVISSGGGR